MPHQNGALRPEVPIKCQHGDGCSPVIDQPSCRAAPIGQLKQLGGIAGWSDHELLNDSMLKYIEEQISAKNKPCMAFIGRWPEHRALMRQHQSLVSLMSARFPQTEAVSSNERQDFIEQSISDNIAQFSSADPTEGALSVQDYLWHTLSALLPDQTLESQTLAQKLFARGSWVLFLQNIGDDPRFTPHGYAHSMEVARWMAQIASLKPEPFKAFCQMYKLKLLQGEALVKLCGLMHDCGYPYLGGKSATKATHAVIGGALFHKVIQPILAQLLSKGSTRNADSLCCVIGRAIHLHSSDNPSDSEPDQLQVFTRSGAVFQLHSVQPLAELGLQLARFKDHIQRVKTTLRSPQDLSDLRQSLTASVNIIPIEHALPPSRLLDVKWPGDKGLSTPCVAVSQGKIPLAYWLMLADNLEISHGRLGKIQSSPIYGSLVFQQHKGPMSARTPAQLRLMAQSLFSRYPNVPVTHLLLHAAATTEHDLPYLVAAQAIGEVELVKSNSEVFKIQVKLRPLPHWLKESIGVCPELEESRYLALYRLQTAIKALNPTPKLELWSGHSWSPIISSADLEQFIKCSGAVSGLSEEVNKQLVEHSCA